MVGGLVVGNKRKEARLSPNRFGSVLACADWQSKGMAFIPKFSHISGEF